jgi:hypothetical protein
MADRSGEKGEGKLGSIIGLLVFVAVCMAAWNVVPVYIANFSFQDKLNEFARSPRGMMSDERIMDEMMKEANRQRLESYLSRQQCAITTRENSRQIECAYERQVEILPGWRHVFSFRPKADQPIL